MKSGHEFFVGNHIGIAFLLLTWLGAAAAWSQSTTTGEPGTLKELQQRFAQQRSLLEKPLIDLNQLYEQQLNTLRDKVRSAGDLEKVLVIDQELKGYQNAGHQPESGFPEIQRLREIYRTELAKRTKEVAAAMAGFQARYAEQLEALARELTKIDRLDEAVAAREEARKMQQAVEGIATTSPLGDPPADSGTSADGGRLRGVGFGSKSDPVGDTARGITDVVEVKYWERDTFDAGWVARRANGTLFSDKEKRLTAGRDHIVAFACSGGGGIVSVLEDGSLDTSLATFQPPTEMEGEVVGLADIALAQTEGGPDSEAVVAVRKDGTLVWWGPATKATGVTGPPEEARRDIARVVSGRGVFTALKRDGSLVAWKFQAGGDGKVNLPTAANGTGFKQLAMSEGHTLALKEDGTVVAWGANNESQSTVPPDLGLCSEVRVLHNVGSLARKLDGTWVAWGRNFGGIKEQLNGKSGVTQIVGRFFPPGQYAYAVWIEEDEAEKR